MKLTARSLTKKLVYPLNEPISDDVMTKYIFYSNQNAYKRELPKQCLKYLVYNVHKDQKRIKIVYTLMQMLIRYPSEMLIFSSELIRILENNEQLSTITKCLICFAKQSIIPNDHLTDQRLEQKIKSISGFVIWGSTIVANFQHIQYKHEINSGEIHRFLMTQVMKYTGILMKLLGEAHQRQHDLRVYKDDVSDVRLGLRQLEDFAYLVNIKQEDVRGACKDLTDLMNSCTNYALALTKSEYKVESEQEQVQEDQ